MAPSLSLSQIKSVRIDGAVRQAQVDLRCARRTERPFEWAHKVGTHRIVILQVALEDVAKVLLAHHHNMIQAFSADRANQALHTTILPR